jgi:predicted nucleic acid-binding protein
VLAFQVAFAVVKQIASLDSSFWINAFRCGVSSYLAKYFDLYVAPAVREEILCPLADLGVVSRDAELFNDWLKTRKIHVESPKRVRPLFQGGEPEAIALAHAKKCLLLIDDSNPYHAARKLGIHVVGTPDFLTFLFFQNELESSVALSKLNALKRSVAGAILNRAIDLVQKTQ